MKRILTTLLLAAGALAASFASLSVEANTTRWTAASGHQYQGIEINRTPSGAQTACANLGAHLVTLGDWNEWSDVVGNVASQRPGVIFWTGAKLPAGSYDFINVTGESYYNVPVSYSPAISMGNDPFTVSLYRTISTGGAPTFATLGWYESSNRHYICEWD